MQNQIIRQLTDEIDGFLKNRQDITEPKIRYIYGGITLHELETRKNEHVNTNSPTVCRNYWKIIPVASYTISNVLKSRKSFQNINRQAEQYLINALNATYRGKCVNDRDNTGAIVQTGGRGIQDDELTDGRLVQFYIFYTEELPKHNKHPIFV